MMSQPQQHNIRNDVVPRNIQNCTWFTTTRCNNLNNSTQGTRLYRTTPYTTTYHIMFHSTSSATTWYQQWYDTFTTICSSTTYNIKCYQHNYIHNCIPNMVLYEDNKAQHVCHLFNTFTTMVNDHPHLLQERQPHLQDHHLTEPGTLGCYIIIYLL
jgi:hypothetical protein